MKATLFFIAFLFNSFGSISQTRKPFAERPQHLSDSSLLELVQKQTFRFFWDFAHPVSGMARERSNVTGEYGWETTTDRKSVV